MYANGMPTMYDGNTHLPLTQDAAMDAASFARFLTMLGLVHEVNEDGYWGVKDDDGHWVLRVADNGDGEAESFLPSDADALADA